MNFDDGGSGILEYGALRPLLYYHGPSGGMCSNGQQ